MPRIYANHKYRQLKNTVILCFLQTYMLGILSEKHHFTRNTEIKNVKEDKKWKIMQERFAPTAAP